MEQNSWVYKAQSAFWGDTQPSAASRSDSLLPLLVQPHGFTSSLPPRLWHLPGLSLIQSACKSCRWIPILKNPSISVNYTCSWSHLLGIGWVPNDLWVHGQHLGKKRRQEGTAGQGVIGSASRAVVRYPTPHSHIHYSPDPPGNSTKAHGKQRRYWWLPTGLH